MKLQLPTPTEGKAAIQYLRYFSVIAVGKHLLFVGNHTGVYLRKKRWLLFAWHPK